jgi:hypothetical protein
LTPSQTLYVATLLSLMCSSGFVASYLKPTLPAPTFPALSVQLSDTDAVAESGLL